MYMLKNSDIAIVLGIIVALVDANSTDMSSCENSISCETCCIYSSCYWCTSLHSCHSYSFNNFDTYFQYCDWADAKWKQCFVNVRGLIITTTIFVALLLMAIISFFLWYEIRRQRVKKEALKKKVAEEEERSIIRQHELDVKHEERKKLTDEIRNKYGLNSRMKYFQED
ncbi:Pituitary tumor-transforming protein -interacting protein [Trichinella pseudospiralis]|uniref:Pituitary tumor-transforming protein-interacting protein n=1 Tax=Trichinella pseudospiralis TaxID=6337 RepID=A0A0V1FZQ4_TRIPS|nr:Pituitary tumor-transforming protein -interacting protein [Trichinella pseudospiralis]